MNELKGRLVYLFNEGAITKEEFEKYAQVLENKHPHFKLINLINILYRKYSWI